MVWPKGSMSTEGETLQVSVLTCRCSICPPLVTRQSCNQVPATHLQRVWQELDYRIDICRVTRGGHIERLKGWTETWSVPPSVNMLLFDVTIPATVQQRSEIREGLMNYTVLRYYIKKKSYTNKLWISPQNLSNYSTYKIFRKSVFFSYSCTALVFFLGKFHQSKDVTNIFPKPCDLPLFR